MSPQDTQGLIGTLGLLRAELRRFLVARTGSEADADDLLSELWIKASTAKTGPIASARSYLFIMANNLLLDRLRETRRRERRHMRWIAEQHGHDARIIEVADASPTAEQVVAQQEELNNLADAIARLPTGAQRVLRLHKIDGLSHAEVARQLGISKSAVEKHMAVAMAHLRRSLATVAPAVPRRPSSGEGPTPDPGVKQ